MLQRSYDNKDSGEIRKFNKRSRNEEILQNIKISFLCYKRHVLRKASEQSMTTGFKFLKFNSRDGLFTLQLCLKSNSNHYPLHFLYKIPNDNLLGVEKSTEKCCSVKRASRTKKWDKCFSFLETHRKSFATAPLTLCVVNI